MRVARQISVIAVLLLGASCSSKKQPAPIVPPPPVAASTQRRTAKPRTPAAAPAPSAPEVQPVPVRPPITLESRTDPAVDRATVESRIRNIQGMLNQLNGRNLVGSAKDDRDRVASMLDVARKSLAGGDVRQASDVSSRAETLARTILNAR